MICFDTIWKLSLFVVCYELVRIPIDYMFYRIAEKIFKDE